MWPQVADIFLSLLPPRYRRPYQMDPVTGTIRSGIFQAIVSLATYATLFFRYLQSFGAFSGSAMSGEALAGRDVHQLSFGLGVIGWLAFSITPGPLLAMYFVMEGTVRAIAGSVTREPMASLPFWLVGEAHGLLKRLRARQRLAPPAPDLVELGQPGDDWDVRVTCVRAKPDWHSLVQVSYNGVLYHITQSGEEQVEGKARFRYCLKKSTDVGAFRGIVQYDPFDYWKSKEPE